MSGAEIRARMSLDASGVKAGAESAGKSVDGLKGQLSKIGPQLAAAFSVGALVGFTKQVIDYAGKISDLASQTGLSTDELQAFQGAVSDAGGTIEGAGKALVNFRNAQDAALSGDKAAAEAFAKLGVSMEDVAGKSTPQLLEAVAKGYQKIRDFGALVDLFGMKQAAKMESALISLAQNGFGPMTEAARQAIEMLSKDDLLALDELGDKMDRMGIRNKTFWGGILNSILGFGQHISNGFAAMFIGIETVAGRVGKNVRNILRGNFKDVVWTPAGLMKEGMAASWQGLKDMNAVDTEQAEASAKSRADAEKALKDVDAKNRAKKLAALKATESAEQEAGLEKLARSIEDDVESGSKEIERAKAAEQKVKEASVMADAKASIPTEPQADAAAGVSVPDLRGAGTEQFRARFDSLRQIGANILGSGKIGGAVDRQGELVTLARQTAENTARLVQQQNAPTVSRLSQSTPVY